MKAIFLTTIFLPLTLTAAEQPPHKLTVNNNSGLDVTVYYHNLASRYTFIESLKSANLTLNPPVQDILVHFNQLNFQQSVPITDVKYPLIIFHHNTITLNRNGEAVAQKMHYFAHNPRLSAHEDQ